MHAVDFQQNGHGDICIMAMPISESYPSELSGVGENSERSYMKKANMVEINQGASGQRRGYQQQGS